MPTDDRIERRLCEWGAWFSAGGAGAGFPTKNILHPSWLPPAPGSMASTASVPTPQCAREREVHEAIGTLSDKLLIVVIGRYGRRMTSAQMALQLRVSSSAIEARLARARQRIYEIVL